MQGIFYFMRMKQRIREGEGVEMALTTDTLQDKLVNGKSLKKILDSETDAFAEKSLPEYLRELCDERGLLPEQVIRKAQIDRTYGHQFFNGRRNPSRDKLIQLAVGFELSLDETQTLLKKAGKGVLQVQGGRSDAHVAYFGRRPTAASGVYARTGQLRKAEFAGI